MGIIMKKLFRNNFPDRKDMIPLNLPSLLILLLNGLIEDLVDNSKNHLIYLPATKLLLLQPARQLINIIIHHYACCIGCLLDEGGCSVEGRLKDIFGEFYLAGLVGGLD